MTADAGSPLDEITRTFQRWLHLTDVSPLYVALATVAANRLDGKPLWVLLVAPPSSGKTALISPLKALRGVHSVSTITEAGLLSGVPQSERTRDATGGLLRSIGSRGIILSPDFGSILEMHREKQKGVLAALRDVHDGHWTRALGTDGGKELKWSGKVGLLGACTPVIDSHHVAMNTLGERFLLFRITVNGAEQARRALRNGGRADDMAKELGEAVVRFFTAIDAARSSTPAVELSPAVETWLVALAELSVRCRSATLRDSYTRDVLVVPEPEAPARLATQLERLLSGLRVIGVDEAQSKRIVAKAALDSMPVARARLLDRLEMAPIPASIVDLADAVPCGTSTLRRHLEDFAAFGIVDAQRVQREDHYSLSEWARTTAKVVREG